MTPRRDEARAVNAGSVDTALMNGGQRFDTQIKSFHAPLQPADRPRLMLMAEDAKDWIAHSRHFAGIDTLPLWTQPAETARGFEAALLCMTRHPDADEAASKPLEHIQGLAAMSTPGVIVCELSHEMAAEWFLLTYGASFTRPDKDIHGDRLPPRPPTGPSRAGEVIVSTTARHVSDMTPAEVAEWREEQALMRQRDADEAPTDMTSPKQERLTNLAAWPGSDGRVSHLLATAPPPLKWFAAKRLPLGRGFAVTGIGGSSKSTFVYQLAIGAVIGRLPWDWQIDQTGSALLFLTEDVADDVHQSLATMADALELTPAERDLLGEKLRVWPLAGVDSRLIELSGQTPRVSAKGEKLIALCKSFGDVVFIGLDPALGLTEGNELDQGHQRFLGQFVDRLAIETGACVLLVSHATKGSANADEITSHQSRGGGALTDALRGEFVLRTMTTKEGKDFGITDPVERKRHVQLLATKGNRLPPEAFAPMWLRRGRGGVLEAAQLTTVAKLPPAHYTDSRVLAVLVEISAASTATLDEWRDECKRRGLLAGDSPDALKKSMQRICDRLIEAGSIERTGRGIYSPLIEGTGS